MSSCVPLCASPCSVQCVGEGVSGQLNGRKLLLRGHCNHHHHHHQSLSSSSLLSLYYKQDTCADNKVWLANHQQIWGGLRRARVNVRSYINAANSRRDWRRRHIALSCRRCSRLFASRVSNTTHYCCFASTEYRLSIWNWNWKVHLYSPLNN